MTEGQWLHWARRVASLAQNGLTYGGTVFDRQRYEELQRIAAEMMAAGGDLPVEQMRGYLRAEDGYATPKLDVRGVVFRGDRILLVREVEDGLWTLPGGWVDAGESPGEAVVKEIAEESGYRTRAEKLLAVYDRDRHGAPPLAWAVCKLFIRCSVIGGQPAGSVETSDVAFFPEDDLPPLSESRVMPTQLRRMFDHLRDSSLPTDFD